MHPSWDLAPEFRRYESGMIARWAERAILHRKHRVFLWRRVQWLKRVYWIWWPLVAETAKEVDGHVFQ